MEELASEGKTILFSTHRLDEADFAHREIKVEQGKIIFDSYDGEQIIKNFTVQKSEVETSKEKKSKNENKSSKEIALNLPATIKILSAVLENILAAASVFSSAMRSRRSPKPKRRRSSPVFSVASPEISTCLV